MNEAVDDVNNVHDNNLNPSISLLEAEDDDKEGKGLDQHQTKSPTISSATPEPPQATTQPPQPPKIQIDLTAFTALSLNDHAPNSNVPVSLLDITANTSTLKSSFSDAVHVWRNVEKFFNLLNVDSDEDIAAFVEKAVPALGLVVGLPNVDEQEGPRLFLPLTGNQKQLVNERIASLLSLIEKYGTTSVTPTMLASKILAIEVSPENEEFIINTVETEFALASGLIEASQRLRDRVEKAVSRRTKGTTVKIYGSSLAEMATHKSDVDLSIFIPELERARELCKNGRMGEQEFMKKQKRAVYGVRDDLQRSGFLDVQPIPNARIPLVKCVDPKARNPHSNDGSLHGDVCFNNQIAVRNSHLLREYAKFDVRCKRLMMVVKLFIKARKIGDAPNGTPSSYCWMNMVIYYLQLVGLVPNLQDAEAFDMINEPNINGLNVNFATAEMAKKSFEPVEDEDKWTLGRLTLGFFKYYAEDFNVRKDVVSIRIGARGDRDALKKSDFPKNKFWRICVEDPFECIGSVFIHDLGMVVGEKGAEVLRDELEQALRIVEGEEGWEGLYEVALAGVKGRKKGGKGGKRREKEKKPKKKTKKETPKKSTPKKDKDSPKKDKDSPKGAEKPEAKPKKKQQKKPNPEKGRRNNPTKPADGGPPRADGDTKPPPKDAEKEKRDRDKKNAATKRRAERRKLNRKKQAEKAGGEGPKDGAKSNGVGGGPSGGAPTPAPSTAPTPAPTPT